MKKIIILLSLFSCLRLSAQISVTFTNVVQPCSGNNGAATAMVTGGTAPYTYQWDKYLFFGGYTTVSTSNSISGMPRGFYKLTVKDVNNVIALDSIFMPGAVYFLHDTIQTSALPIKGINITANCPIYQGNFAAAIGGTNSPYIFSLTGAGTQTTSATTSNFNNLPIGNYICTVMDNSGCTDTVPVGVYSSPGYSVNVPTTPDTCTSNGTAMALPVGGAAPYTYLWNTSPPQTTQMISGLTSSYNASFYLNVSVTDVNGCVAIGYPYVLDSITPHSIQSTATIQNATCGFNDGAIFVSNSGGLPPYKYLWSNGSTNDSLFNLFPGTYTVTVTDSAGCHEKFIKQVYTISLVNVWMTPTNTNCSNTGGGITTSVSGGTPPYSYQWSNGQTGANLTNVGAGFYYVNVIDSNGCNAWAADSIFNPNNCVAKISGQIFNDMNGNCLFDSNESGLPQQIVQLSNGLTCYTDATGKYYFPPVLNPTGTYTLNQTPLYPWNQVCPGSAITLNPIGGNVYSNNDFYDQPIPLQNDLEVHVITDSCRPGFSFNQYVVVFNRGTSTMSGTIDLRPDALLNIISTGNATAYNSSSNTFSFSFANFPPMTYFVGYVVLQASASTPLFTPLTSYAIANPVSGDITPANNYDTLHYRVTGSYDPNSKSVTPAGVGPGGNISTTDKQLSYVIHFQNTGSYPTTFVTIIDTIDSDLDIHTLKITGSWAGGSYYNVNPKVTFLAPNVVKFDFQYCYLQPVKWDTAKSQGFISYTIDQKPGLSIGTQITNRADIYFDYNTAILTNTTLNTINAIGLNEYSSPSSFKIFPNPGENELYVECSDIEGILSVKDLLGKSFFNAKFNLKEKIDISGLKPGVYFLELRNESKNLVGKFIKQ